MYSFASIYSFFVSSLTNALIDIEKGIRSRFIRTRRREGGYLFHVLSNMHLRVRTWTLGVLGLLLSGWVKRSILGKFLKGKTILYLWKSLQTRETTIRAEKSLDPKLCHKRSKHMNIFL